MTIVLGLASRRLPATLPAWLAKDPGDVLYAVMVYWAVRLFMPTVQFVRPAAIATAVCFTIELIKFLHFPVLDAFRLTGFGRLMLGVGFQTSNLVCYILGVALAVAVERLLTSRGAPQVQ